MDTDLSHIVGAAIYEAIQKIAAEHNVPPAAAGISMAYVLGQISVVVPPENRDEYVDDLIDCIKSGREVQESCFVDERPDRLS